MIESSSLTGFPGGSVGKESAGKAGDLGSIPGEGSGKPHQHSCLENSMNEPDGLQSMGSQRVEHDLVTFTFTFP